VPVLIIALAAAGGWYAWRRWAAPVPPEVAMGETDPVLGQAIEAARGRVREDPYSPAAWANLGKLLRGANFYRPAAVCFCQAERLQPGEPRWPYLQGESLRLHEPALALEHLQRAVGVWERQGGTPLAPRLQLAAALLEAGRYDEADAQLERGLAADPNDPNLCLARGEVAWARGDPRVSREYLLRCRDNPATRQRACTLLAAVYRRLGDTAAAENYSGRATTLPSDTGWLDPYVRECLQAVVGRTARFQRVEALEGQQRYADAIALLRDMAAEAPNDASVFAFLGRDLAQIGDLREAEQALGRAVELAPASVPANYALGKVLLALGNAPKAAAAERQVLEKQPDHGLAHLVLGRALRELGQPQEALKIFRRAVECIPDEADAWLCLAEAEGQAGHLVEAKKCLQEAARLAKPDDERPAAALKKLMERKQSGREPG
jgi:tetratricopeptide (TPR) repeat protein